MSKSKKILAAGTAVIALSAIGAQEAKAATGNGSMSASVVAPITVTNSVTLNFGAVANGAGPGTLAIAATTGTPTPGGTATAVGGSPAAGVLSVSGSPQAIDVTMTATQFTVTETVGGVATMTVNAFNLLTDAGGTTAQVTPAGTSTPATLPVGATLNLVNGQTAGVYQGTYTVTASYN